jgi:hypothetical protein
MSNIQWPKVACYHSLIVPNESWKPEFEICTMRMIFREGIRQEESCALDMIKVERLNLIFTPSFYQGSVLALETQLSGEVGEPVTFHSGWEEELLSTIENECRLFRQQQSVQNLITKYVFLIPNLYRLCCALPPDGQRYVRDVPPSSLLL